MATSLSGPAEISLHSLVGRVFNVPTIRRPTNNLELERLGPVGASQLNPYEPLRDHSTYPIIDDLRPVVHVAGLEDDQPLLELIPVHVVASGALFTSPNGTHRLEVLRVRRADEHRRGIA